MDDFEEEQKEQQFNNEPIDGQMEIGEFFIRDNGEETEEETPPSTPIENQLGFEDLQSLTVENNKETFKDLENEEIQSQNLLKDNLDEEEKQTKEDIEKSNEDIEQTSEGIKQVNNENNFEEDLKASNDSQVSNEIEVSREQTQTFEFEENEIEEPEQDNNFYKEYQEKHQEEQEDFYNQTVVEENNYYEEDEEILEKEDEFTVANSSNKSANNKERAKASGNKSAQKVALNKVNKSPAKKPTEKVKAEKVLNNESLELANEVEKSNSNISDIDLTVGKDVFSDYENNEISTETVKEEEIDVIEEKVISEDSGNDVVDGMLYKNLDKVLHESMIPYSEHVILDRAIPRVEDGLKPVQRRILYSMMELGVTPDKPFRKSARIVGDCLGKYHPHGDSSVYDAMVRMAQPFNTNVLLVNGHGNFGSVDGDGAAAMRYTEARLAPLAMELLRDLDKNTVKWGLNFDDTLKEPEILPGRFPNLLVNGSTGIAVGLATNIPPHNLAETIDGVVSYINNPKITLKEMLKIIKGPDFPTGGYILSSSEIMQAYETGKGRVFIRAKMHIETNNSDKKYIVITELPYQVNKSNLLQKINMFREEDKFGLGAISEVRDESDRDGLRAVIRLKKDANVKQVFDSLVKNTELQCTFGINMVAIANGKPKQMGLLDIISYYAEYQREIILRRSKYECEQAKEREHILSGLIIAIKNIDAVVKIIKTSKNTTEAKKRLREKFILSEKQAQAILDMRLARLTSLEVYKLEEELKKLRELIKKLTAIIESKKLQYQVVKDELNQIKKEHKTERKTKILKDDKALEISSVEAKPKEVVPEERIILKTALNNFKCVSLKQYNQAQKEITENSSLSDIHTYKFETYSTKYLIAFSNLGNCFKVHVKDFGEFRYKDKGISEKIIFKNLEYNETIVALFELDEGTDLNQNLIFLTKQGMIKKTALSEYTLLKKYFQGMKLKEGDEILKIELEPKAYTIVFVTNQGMVLNALTNDIPLQGRISGGVKGINLATKDYCVGVDVANEEGEIIAITNKGYAKRVVVSQVEKLARYRKGLKLISFASDNGSSLILGGVVTKPSSVVVFDAENNMFFRKTDLVPIETRIGKGKAIDKFKKGTIIEKSYKTEV